MLNENEWIKMIQQPLAAGVYDWGMDEIGISKLVNFQSP